MRDFDVNLNHYPHTATQGYPTYKAKLIAPIIIVLTNWILATIWQRHKQFSPAKKLQSCLYWPLRHFLLIFQIFAIVIFTPDFPVPITPTTQFWLEIALLAFEKPTDKLSWLIVPQDGVKALRKLPRSAVLRQKGKFLLSAALLEEK